MKKIDIFNDENWYDEEFSPNSLNHHDKELKDVKEKIKGIIKDNLYSIGIENIKNEIEEYLSGIENIKNYKIYVTGIYSFDIYIEIKDNNIIFNCQIKNRLS